MKQLVEPFLTTAQFSTQTDATLRQLQWWDEQGFLPALRSSDGGNRRYGTNQLKLARLFVGLRDRRTGPQVSRVFRLLRRRTLLHRLERFVAVRPDGGDVLVADTGGELIRLLEDSDCGWFVVEVG